MSHYPNFEYLLREMLGYPIPGFTVSLLPRDIPSGESEASVRCLESRQQPQSAAQVTTAGASTSVERVPSTHKMPKSKSTKASGSPAGKQKSEVLAEDASESDETNSLAYREQRAIADLLTRFKNMISLVALPEGDERSSLEVASAQAFQMEVESTAMIRATEDLLQLTREMKEAWLFGPIRGLGEGEQDGQMAEDAKAVGEVIETLLEKTNQGHAVNMSSNGDKSS